jgi:TP901 family phage tail tape measure protein
MATIGVKVKLEGAAEYRQQMSQMTSQTKLYQAQMKNLQSQLNKSAFAKSIQESKLLSQQLETLKQKSAAMSDHIEKASAAYGENSTYVNRLKTQYENLQAEINQVNAALQAHGGFLGAVGAQLQQTGSEIQAVGDKISGIGDKLTQTITLPLAAAGVASIKAFSDWESAFTGVMKTVDETANTTYDDIAEGIKKIATETASSKEEIAAVAEAAGQLGVSADDVLTFTKTMVMLGDTTNLSAEEAASSLAKFMNITGESQQDVDRIGSSIVALGNNFATTESDIVEMSTRLASAGTIAGLSSTDILALSAAMSSVGINAEAGGTAMSQTLAALEKNVAKFKSGAENNLEEIARISGVSAEEFAKKWEQKPIVAIQGFIKGLGELDENGESATMVLDELGMSGIRQSNMLKALSLASGELSDAVVMSNTAYQDNSALVSEAEKRYATFEARLSQLKEKIGNVAIEIGERLMPYVEKLMEYADELIAKWDEMDPATQDMIVKAAMIAAAIGPILAVGGRLISGIGMLTSGLGNIMSMAGTLAESLPALGAAITAITGPVAIAIAAIAALVAGFVYLYNTNEEFRVKVQTAWESIKETISGICVAIEELVSAFMVVLQQFWDEHGEQITAFLTALFEILTTMFTTMLENLQLVIQTITALIQGDWETAWNNVKQIFINLWEMLKSYLASVLNLLLSLIVAQLQKVIQNITEKLNTVKTIITTLIDSLRATIKNDLIDKALSWGSDFVQNFIDGITSKMSALLEKVKAMADSIRSYLHFSEPDKGPLKDFNSWPRDMMEQYAEGIENGRYLVQRAVSDVSADVAMMSPDSLTADEIYSAINAGASDANITLVVGDRELGRALRGMGVVMA